MGKAHSGVKRQNNELYSFRFFYYHTQFSFHIFWFVFYKITNINYFFVKTFHQRSIQDLHIVYALTKTNRNAIFFSLRKIISNLSTRKTIGSFLTVSLKYVEQESNKIKKRNVPSNDHMLLKFCFNEQQKKIIFDMKIYIIFCTTPFSRFVNFSRSISTTKSTFSNSSNSLILI